VGLNGMTNEKQVKPLQIRIQRNKLTSGPPLNTTLSCSPSATINLKLDYSAQYDLMTVTRIEQTV